MGGRRGHPAARHLRVHLAVRRAPAAGTAALALRHRCGRCGVGGSLGGGRRLRRRGDVDQRAVRAATSALCRDGPLARAPGRARRTRGDGAAGRVSRRRSGRRVADRLSPWPVARLGERWARRRRGGLVVSARGGRPPILAGLPLPHRGALAGSPERGDPAAALHLRAGARRALPATAKMGEPQLRRLPAPGRSRGRRRLRVARARERARQGGRRCRPRSGGGSGFCVGAGSAGTPSTVPVLDGVGGRASSGSWADPACRRRR